MCPALPKRNSIWKPFRRQLHPGHMLRALCHHSVRRHPRTSLLCTSLRLTFSTLCLQVKVRSISTLTSRKHLEMTCGCDVEPRVESVSRTSSRPISIGNSRRDIKNNSPQLVCLRQRPKHTRRGTSCPGPLSARTSPGLDCQGPSSRPVACNCRSISVLPTSSRTLRRQCMLPISRKTSEHTSWSGAETLNTLLTYRVRVSPLKPVED